MLSARGRGSGSAGEAQPQRARASSSSSRSRPRTRPAPSAPAAARPQRAGRPTSTASAPRASAIATSTPRRMPPSTSTVARPSTRVDDLGQGIAAGQRPVELAAAVVGDDDAGGAVRHRQLRVLRRQQALDQDRQAGLGGELLEVGPAQRRVHQPEGLLDRHRPLDPHRRRDARNPQAVRDLEAGAAVALAVAAARRVDGDDDRLEAATRPLPRSGARVTASSLKQ